MSWMIPGMGMFLEAYYIFRCACLARTPSSCVACCTCSCSCCAMGFTANVTFDVGESRCPTLCTLCAPCGTRVSLQCHQFEGHGDSGLALAVWQCGASSHLRCMRAVSVTSGRFFRRSIRRAGRSTRPAARRSRRRVRAAHTCTCRILLTLRVRWAVHFTCCSSILHESRILH